MQAAERNPSKGLPKNTKQRNATIIVTPPHSVEGDSDGVTHMLRNIALKDPSIFSTVIDLVGQPARAASDFCHCSIELCQPFNGANFSQHRVSTLTMLPLEVIVGSEEMQVSLNKCL